MPLSDAVWIALLGAVSGLMIGCIGIGGIILVPALVFVAGIAIQIAIPAAMFAYILLGLVATFVFARNKSLDWRMASSLCIGGARRHSPARGPLRSSTPACWLAASAS